MRERKREEREVRWKGWKEKEGRGGQGKMGRVWGCRMSGHRVRKGRQSGNRKEREARSK